MTRQEQIKEMAKFHARCITSDKDLQVAFADALRRGAEWSDKHPDIDVRTMAAWRSGYKEAIEKACEYLEEYTPQKFDDVQNYVENFRKAMNGD